MDERLTGQNKELKRIDWEIVRNIIAFLYYNNRTKRTNIAIYLKMNYQRCILYLGWMKKMDLILQELDSDGFELISPSARGIKVYKEDAKEL
jgi:predicted transcriptional regulator